MQSVTLKSVMEAMSRRLGRHPDATDAIEPEQRKELIGYLGVRLAEVWGWAWWPDLMKCEERLVLTDATSGEPRIDFETAEWSALTTYAVGDVRQRYGKRYEALLAGLNQDPATATTYWSEVTRTPIGAVKMVTTNNPLASDYPEEWPFQPKDAGVVVTDTSVGTSVWVLCRTKCPELTGEAWESGVAYVAGDVRYHEEAGDCYRCRRGTASEDPETSTDYWEKLEIPAILRAALVELSLADAFYSDDREGEAEKLEDRGYEKLEIAGAIALKQQRVTETAGVVNLG